MTVAELIAKLQEVPQDAPIGYYDDEWGDVREIEYVSVGTYKGEATVCVLDHDNGLNYCDGWKQE
jgi:hypothetical protein